MQKQRKLKNEYRIAILRLHGELVSVWVHKRDIRALKHIVKSGSAAALEAVLHDITDEESERIANGERRTVDICQRQ